VIEKLYLERVPKRPGPIPDPPPDFKPLVIPSGAPIENTGLVFRSARIGLSQAEIQSGEQDKKFLETAVARLKGTASSATLDGAPVAAGLSVLEKPEIAAVARIADWQRVFYPCFVEAVPGLLLGFQEYDRTDSEKLGGSYTGTGPRQNLGLAATGRYKGIVCDRESYLLESWCDTFISIRYGQV